jgi:hypothetical protein
MATVQLISTMATPLLVYGYTIQYEAIDATTGDAVDGVEITDPNLTGVNLSQNDTGATELADETPLFLTIPDDESEDAT